MLMRGEQCKKEKGSGNSSLFWAKCKIHHPYVCIGIKEGSGQYMKVTITIRMYLIFKYIIGYLVTTAMNEFIERLKGYFFHELS